MAASKKNHPDARGRWGCCYSTPALARPHCRSCTPGRPRCRLEAGRRSSSMGRGWCAAGLSRWRPFWLASELWCCREVKKQQRTGDQESGSARPQSIPYCSTGIPSPTAISHCPMCVGVHVSSVILATAQQWGPSPRRIRGTGPAVITTSRDRGSRRLCCLKGVGVPDAVSRVMLQAMYVYDLCWRRSCPGPLRVGSSRLGGASVGVGNKKERKKERKKEKGNK